MPGLLPPGDKTFNAGSTVPVKFQLTSANGQPIAGDLAASLGCTVNVTFNGGGPCADPDGGVRPLIRDGPHA